MFYMEIHEPEGWLRAFVVYFAGKEVATFRYWDCAEAYISDHLA